MHPMSLRQRPDRQPPPVAIPPDLLEQLHPRSHSFCHPSSQLQEDKTLGQPSDGGGANSTCRSGANSECRTQIQGNRAVSRINDAAMPAGTYLLRAHASDLARNEAST